MKKCYHCSIVKPLSDFPKDRNKKSGYRGNCKSCDKLRQDKNPKDPTKPSQCTQLRFKALEILGIECVRCGFNDIRALQIDHVNGGGRQEHIKLGSYGVYRQIVNGRTKDFQVLCANCNWIKRYENQEVPLTPGWYLQSDTVGSPSWD